MTEIDEKIESFVSQLNESNDKLSLSLSLNQRLEKQLQESEANNASLTSQLNEYSTKLSESYDKLSLSSSLNQRLEKQLQESEANNASLTSQLNEYSTNSSEVEKNYMLLSGDRDALSNISLEQCDELILTSNHNQERLLLRRVSNETYL